MFKTMPSFRLSVIVVVLSFSTVGVLHWADAYCVAHNIATFEQVMWTLIHRLGWIWWGLYVGLAIVALWYMARLDRPRTRWGMTTRVIGLSGCCFYMFSPGNTSFGPLGALFVLLAFCMWNRQQAKQCEAERPHMPRPAGVGIATRLYLLLSTELWKEFS